MGQGGPEAVDGAEVRRAGRGRAGKLVLWGPLAAPVLAASCRGRGPGVVGREVGAGCAALLQGAAGGRLPRAPWAGSEAGISRDPASPGARYGSPLEATPSHVPFLLRVAPPLVLPTATRAARSHVPSVSPQGRALSRPPPLTEPSCVLLSPRVHALGSGLGGHPRCAGTFPAARLRGPVVPAGPTALALTRWPRSLLSFVGTLYVQTCSC